MLLLQDLHRGFDLQNVGPEHRQSQIIHANPYSLEMSCMISQHRLYPPPTPPRINNGFAGKLKKLLQIGT